MKKIASTTNGLYIAHSERLLLSGDTWWHHIRHRRRTTNAARATMHTGASCTSQSIWLIPLVRPTPWSLGLPNHPWSRRRFPTKNAAASACGRICYVWRRRPYYQIHRRCCGTCSLTNVCSRPFPCRTRTVNSTCRRVEWWKMRANFVEMHTYVKSNELYDRVEQKA